MNVTEKAIQIWPILVLCASRRETLTYDVLGKLIGVRAPIVPELLEPIQSYCLLEGLAPLASIVVNQATGLTADGFITAANLPRAQADVYARDWLSDGLPKAELLQDAFEGMRLRRARDKQRRARARQERRAAMQQTEEGRP